MRGTRDAVAAALLLLGSMHAVAGTQAQAVAAGATLTRAASGSLEWRASFPHEVATLRVMGPDGLLLERVFAGGTVPSLTIQAGQLRDGSYSYELVFLSESATGNRVTGAAARAPASTATYTGSFRVIDGVLYDGAGGEAEPRAAARTPTASAARSNTVQAVARPQDIVQPDDLIVQGSICVGFDCVDGESFGFDTLRLKENNTRIKFDDTSATAGFPMHDWQLTANDSASGGVERFSIEDVTASTVPFTVRGSAPSNSLYVDPAGRIGLRTSTPVLDVHMATGDTPAIRLEQNTTVGYTAQTWDVAGNEANFFVRDLTAGSRLPLRIRPGAPTSSVDVAASGNVGIGTATPGAAMHVYRGNGTASLLVEEASPTIAGRTLLALHNYGTVGLRLTSSTDSASGSGWFVGSGTDLVIDRFSYTGGSVPATPPTTGQLRLTPAGNLTIAGTLTQGSSRTIKENIVAADPGRILEALRAMPVYLWNYKAGSQADRHLGPLAEDFFSAFRLGLSDKSIAPSDLAGVALGAVQALARALSDKEDEIRDLKERLRAIEAVIDTHRVR